MKLKQYSGKALQKKYLGPQMEVNRVYSDKVNVTLDIKLKQECMKRTEDT